MARALTEKGRRSPKSALDVMEEATGLLRSSFLDLVPLYLIGSLPFFMGLLFFWARMSGSGRQNADLAGWSLALAALFVWMKSWQAAFATKVRALAAGLPGPAWTLHRTMGLVARQTGLQSVGIFLLPVTAMATLPFPWAFAFFQNASALEDGEQGGMKELVRRASRQAALWPGQNAMLLALFSGFGLLVMANVALAVIYLPHLAKSLFGVETLFTMSQFSFLNTTYLSTVLSITYLCVDPLVKAAYALRCFYGESRSTGEDLLAELASFPRAATVVMVLAAGLLLLGVPALRAASPVPMRTHVAEAQARTVSAPELDQAIRRVLERPEYDWLSPKKEKQEEKAATGFVADILRFIGRMVANVFRIMLRWIEKIIDFFREIIPESEQEEKEGSGWTIGALVHILLWVIIAACVAVLTIGLWRRQGRLRKKAEALPVLAETLPDIRDESVSASDLPADRWLAMAADLAAQGAFREAVRAQYLSGLARLSDRELLSLAAFKSNRDYSAELRRRAGACPGLPEIFAEQVAAFDASWYGRIGVTRDLYALFAQKTQRMAALAQT